MELIGHGRYEPQLTKLTPLMNIFLRYPDQEILLEIDPDMTLTDLIRAIDSPRLSSDRYPNGSDNWQLFHDGQLLTDIRALSNGDMVEILPRHLPLIDWDRLQECISSGGRSMQGTSNRSRKVTEEVEQFVMASGTREGSMSRLFEQMEGQTWSQCEHIEHNLDRSHELRWLGPGPHDRLSIFWLDDNTIWACQVQDQYFILGVDQSIPSWSMASSERNDGDFDERCPEIGYFSLNLTAQQVMAIVLNAYKKVETTPKGDVFPIPGQDKLTPLALQYAQNRWGKKSLQYPFWNEVDDYSYLL